MKLMKSRGSKGLRVKIQTKLLGIFLVSMVIIFAINTYVYANIDGMMTQIDEIYSSNAKLNYLQTTLKLVQDDMTEYLNDKKVESLENYYKDMAEYQNLMEDLNQDVVGNEHMIMEKNIYNISKRYCETSELAMKYRRGYIVEKYKKNYEEATHLYTSLEDGITGLNSRLFRNNFENYQLLIITLHRVKNLNLLIFGLTGVLSLVMIWLMTQGITYPLSKLSETAQEVASGNFDVGIVEVTSNDEVGVVTGTFNQMVLSIREYIEKLKQSMETERLLQEKELKMETYLKDAQLKYLQAQISPHFLFNTLNAGAQLAMLEDAEKTYEYIQRVAEFYRYNVKKDYGRVSLREEIELVDTYIYIINVRFSGEIHYRKEVDESLTYVPITAMTLQPLVENCINHGIRGIDWQGEIVLSVYRDDKDVCISVSDNGIGMSKERITQILSNTVSDSEEDKNSNGIGINNVIDRLSLYYGRENMVEIYSDGENLGSEFIIRIPMELIEGENNV